MSSLSLIAQSLKSKKKAKKDDSPRICNGGVHIEMAQELSMSFQLKYLISISKCAVLSDHVQLMLKNDNPLLVSNFLYLWGILLAHLLMPLLIPGLIHIHRQLYPVLPGCRRTEKSMTHELSIPVTDIPVIPQGSSCTYKIKLNEIHCDLCR